MHKRKVKKVARIASTTIPLLGAVGTGTLAAYALRENNVRSGELYVALQEADESGVEVTEALQALQLHVTTHMNASPLPQLGDNAPVQLNKSYERAKLAEATRATSERDRVNAEAIASCEEQFGTASLVTRTQCVARYVSPNPAVPEQPIVPELYKYDFVSPLWTPDKAGVLVLVTLILLGAVVIQLTSRLVVRMLIKQ